MCWNRNNSLCASGRHELVPHILTHKIWSYWQMRLRPCHTLLLTYFSQSSIADYYESKAGLRWERICCSWKKTEKLLIQTWGCLSTFSVFLKQIKELLQYWCDQVIQESNISKFVMALERQFFPDKLLPKKLVRHQFDETSSKLPF